MACISEILQYYTDVPPISISDENLPKYVIMINQIMKDTMREYSECRPILKEKEITTTSDQYTIDIFNEIDDKLIDIVIFDKKENLLNGIFIPELNQIITPVILDTFEDYRLSFLNVQYIYDNIYMLKEYFENRTGFMIFNGNMVKCEPNTTYYFLYEAYREESDFYEKDCKDLKDLFAVNLVLNMIDSMFFTDEQPIRSVSISGISVTFNVEDKKTVRKQLLDLKSTIKAKLCNIYEFVERW